MNWIDDFLEFTKNVEAPEKFLRWSAISAIAGCLERRVWINVNGMHCYPNMFIMLVGPAGLAKKSSSSGKAMGLLKDVKGLKFMSDQITEPSLVTQLFEAGTNKYVELHGNKYNNSSLFIYSSEAVVTLKANFGSVIQTLTDFYDCNPNGWHLEQAWTKVTKSDGETRIYNPCVNLLACTTPTWLTDIMGPKDIQGGFASRMLFIFDDGSTVINKDWLDEADLESESPELRNSLVARLTKLTECKGSFTIEKPVREAFNAIKIELRDKLRNSGPDKMIHYYARKPWHLLKLAQVLSMADSQKLVLGLKHFEQAKTLLKEIEPAMKEAFGGMGSDPKAKFRHELFQWTLSNPKFTLQDAMKRFWNDTTKSLLIEELATLREMGKLDVLTERVNGKGIVIYQLIDRRSL